VGLVPISPAAYGERKITDYIELVAAGWPWAPGGMVLTPTDLEVFTPGCVGGDHFGPKTLARQRRVVEGGPTRRAPRRTLRGLASSATRRGAGPFGATRATSSAYTQFIAASPNGRRSVTVSVNEQLTPKDGAPGAFKALRLAGERAGCAALADH
jgi:D-alanyl-D-alanine carboxypeptidase